MIRKIIYTLFLVFGFLNCSLNSFAQKGYTITNYTVNEGLAQSTVYSIIQDKRGYLWFSTYGGGLSRFDGVDFKTFTKQDSIKDDKIYSLFEDSKENIWIGTRTGLTVYNGFEFENIDIKKNEGIFQIRDIIEDEIGNIWLASYGNGLVKISQDKSIHVYSEADGLSSNYLFSLECYNQRDILIGTKEGVDYFDGKRFTKFGKKQEHKQNNIRSILKVEDKTILIGAYGDGVSQIKNNSYSYLNSNSFGSGVNVMSIIKARDGAIWVATFGEGIYKMTKDTIYNFTFQNSELSTNNILSLYEDNLGNIWAGTFLGGVCKIAETAFYSYTEKDGLKDPSVENLYQLKNGRILMTSMSGGLMQLHNGKIESSKYSEVMKDKRITSVFEGSNGVVWMTTDGDGVYKFANEKIQVLRNSTNEIFSDQVYVVTQTSDSSLWFGTYGDGLIVYKNGEYKKYNKEYERGLNSNLILDIKEDKNGTVWIATSGGGISSYDGINFTNHKLSETDFVSIKLDVFDNIWFSSNGGGVYMYNGKEFTSFNTKDGLLSNNVNLICFDNANNLWVGTEKGINKIVFELKDTLEGIKYLINNIESYSKEDGMVGLETNQNAVLKDFDGNLWFGTIKGVSRYNPKADKFNIRAPKAQITSLKLFDKNTNWKDYADSILPWNNLPMYLSLKYNQNSLTFDFVGINLKVPHGVVYKYKLEGFDEEWVEGKRNFATYSNLPSGEYTFQVLARNEDNVWQQTATDFKFSIDKPFWLKLWFIVLVILIIVFSVYVFIKRRDAEIRKINLRLERLVNERTVALKIEKENVEKINSEVEKKNEQILDSIQYAKKIQLAILPPTELVREKLPEFGIFYEAKDIVSGDFYWLTEEGGKVFFATVDCTGHGVPGAFMSIVGYRLLELIVSGYKIYEPAEVLDELHMQVLETLHKQKGSAKDITDGMDLALCSWDKEKSLLKYSGAHNSLYLIREGELIEFDPNLRPIGMSMMKEFKRFEQHEIEIQRDDIIYIFTDGFADQFGGPKFRKYYYQNFQNFLISIHKEPMEKQEELIKQEFYQWKGDNEQIDDVLIFGVRF